MKKIFLGLIFSFVIFNSQAQAAFQDWKLINEYVQPLIPDATSEDLGRVVYRTYERESPRGTLEIILTEGKGTGSLYVPELVNDSKQLLPAAEYKILELEDGSPAGSHKAILENQSYLPLALAIQVDDNVILNIESSSLNQEELILIAREILSSWNFIESDLSPAR